jgi:hypothetical protein
MARQSKLPAGENLTTAMQAFLENIDRRVPSNTAPLSGAATLADVIAAYNQLIIDLNK